MGLIRSIEDGLAWVLQCLIRLYQITLSPFIGNQCRFYPTCSHYAQEAVAEFGPWRGTWLTLRRLSRCHPLAEGGIDPIPGTAANACANSCDVSNAESPEREQPLSNHAAAPVSRNTP